MLYFSKIGIDPDKIDVSQIEKLNAFKEKTYPEGLIQSYKSHIDFYDKFSKELERKVRDLQESDSSRVTPLSLAFLSLENDEPIGSIVNYTLGHPHVSDYGPVPSDKLAQVKQSIQDYIKYKSYLPVPLLIANSSASGIRNVYIELSITPASDNADVSDTEPINPFARSLSTQLILRSMSLYLDDEPSSRSRLSARFSRFKFGAGKLRRTDKGWILAFEWEAIQPQRIRLIEPLLYVYSPESTSLAIEAKIFADSFPEPQVLKASIEIEAKQENVALTDLLPNWQALLKTAENAGGLLSGLGAKES